MSAAVLATIPWELLLRIAVGTVLGGIIGYERDIHGRPAGLRTHMIVGLASATFMVVSTNFVYHQHFQHADMVEVDASRIAASIVTGMGFLAGGAILRTGVSVQGLTTAAALWLVGAIGMASGAGMFGVAIFVTVMGVIALTALRRFEDKDSRTTHRHRIDLVLGEEVSTAQISTRLRELGVVVSTVKQERKPEKKTQSLTLDVRVPAEVDFETLVGSLGADPGVRRVRVERVA
ncbi:MAG: magnesium transporter [Myxococcaceae bacterium]